MPVLAAEAVLTEVLETRVIDGVEDTAELELVYSCEYIVGREYVAVVADGVA